MSLLRFAKELQNGKSDIDFIQNIINEANSYIEQKRAAAHKRWNAPHMQSDAPHSSANAHGMHSNASSSSSSSSSTEAVQNKTLKEGGGLESSLVKFKELHLKTCGLNTLPPIKIFREILESDKSPDIIEDVYQLHGGDIQVYRQRNIVQKLTEIRDGTDQEQAMQAWINETE